MERKISFVLGEYYHVYNRGVEKRTIFLDANDYRRFLLLLHVLNTKENLKIRDLLRENSYEELLKKKNKSPIVAIGAYCLMPNHFHLLLTPIVEGGIPKFMLKLQTAYAMYFNNMNERTGALFQGAFRSEHVADDNYLRYLYSYIHLNPAKLKDKNWRECGPKDFFALREFVLSYSNSSMREYKSNNFVIINPEPFPEYRKLYKSDQEYFEHMVDEWLDFKGSAQGSPVQTEKV